MQDTRYNGLDQLRDVERRALARQRPRKLGVQRDNCPACEGTGQIIDFAAIRARAEAR